MSKKSISNSLLKTIIESRIQYYIDTISLNEDLNKVIDKAQSKTKTDKEKVRDLFIKIKKEYDARISAAEEGRSARRDYDSPDAAKLYIESLRSGTLKAQGEQAYLASESKDTDKVTAFAGVKLDSLFIQERVKNLLEFQEVNYPGMAEFYVKKKYKTFKLIDKICEKIIEKARSNRESVNYKTIYEIFKEDFDDCVKIINKAIKAADDNKFILDKIEWPSKIDVTKEYTDDSDGEKKYKDFLLLLTLLEGTNVEKSFELYDFDTFLNTLILFDDPGLIETTVSSEGLVINVNNEKRNLVYWPQLFDSIDKIKKNTDKDLDWSKIAQRSACFIDISKDADVDYIKDKFRFLSARQMTLSENQVSLNSGIFKLVDMLRTGTYRKEDKENDDKNVSAGLLSQLSFLSRKNEIIEKKILENLAYRKRLEDEKRKKVFNEVFDNIVGKEGEKLKEYFLTGQEKITGLLLKDFMQSITSLPMTSTEVLSFFDIIDSEQGRLFDDYDIKILSTSNNLKNISPEKKFMIEPITSSSMQYNPDGDGGLKERYGFLNNVKSVEFNDGLANRTIDTTTSTKDVEKILEERKKRTQAKISKDIKERIERKDSFDIRHIIGMDVDIPTTSKFSFFMLNDPRLRISSRNELELSTFLNVMNTVELSKIQPYLDVILEIPTADGKKQIATSSITNHFFNKKDATDLGPGLRKDVNYAYDYLSEDISDKRIKAVKNNMSIFTTPQTLNNFYERDLIREDKHERNYKIQDITRPFMSINSFTIDVAPTQGLMSFKTGKISLTLHDKTRIFEVSPFVKPDMFGVHGSEIKVTYGWSSIDENYKTNFLGAFLGDQKVTERYIITNSSFNITQNGEVKIDLSIAMRGPIDLKNINVIEEGSSKINFDLVQSTHNTIKSKEIELKNSVSSDKKSIKYNFKLIDEVYRDITKLKSIKILKYDDSVKKIIERIEELNVKAFDRGVTKDTVSRADTIKFLNSVMYAIVANLNIKKDQLIYPDSNVKDILTVNNTLTSEEFKKIREHCVSLRSLYAMFFKQAKAYVASLSYLKRKTDDSVNNLLEGLRNVDPFYDRLLLQQYHTSNNIKKSVPKSIGDLISLKRASDSNFFSLGSFMAGVVCLNLVNTQKYDDIQIISYCANKNAGLMSGKNLSSILIRRKQKNGEDGIEDFLFDIFASAKGSLTVEGLLSQVIEKFVNTNSNISFGLSDLYKFKNGVLTPKSENPKKQQKAITEKLTFIYNMLYGEQNEKVEPIFVPPKIRFSFDTLVNKEDKTILRISIYDDNDNPFKAISDMFVNDKDNELLQFSTELGRTSVMGSKKEYTEKAAEVINSLISNRIIKEDPQNSGTYVFNRKDVLPIKREIKKKVPSVTYGTQSSAIIDASVTTVNEAKLNTVFITRSGIQRQDKGKKLLSPEELPLNVLPAQATATIYGCPFINFAQMIYMDFETNTTLDNIYAVTGIKHDLSPGKFTTSLTLTYADIFGKYRTAISNVSEALKSTPRESTATTPVDEKSTKTEEKITRLKAKSVRVKKLQSLSDYDSTIINTISAKGILSAKSDSKTDGNIAIEYYFYYNVLKNSLEKKKEPEAYAYGNKIAILREINSQEKSREIEISPMSISIEKESKPIQIKEKIKVYEVTQQYLDLQIYHDVVKNIINLETLIKSFRGKETKVVSVISIGELGSAADISNNNTTVIEISKSSTIDINDRFIDALDVSKYDFKSKFKIIKGKLTFDGKKISNIIGNVAKLQLYGSTSQARKIVPINLSNVEGIKEFLKRILNKYTES